MTIVKTAVVFLVFSSLAFGQSEREPRHRRRVSTPLPPISSAFKRALAAYSKRATPPPEPKLPAAFKSFLAAYGFVHTTTASPPLPGTNLTPEEHSAVSHAVRDILVSYGVIPVEENNSVVGGYSNQPPTVDASLYFPPRSANTYKQPASVDASLYFPPRGANRYNQPATVDASLYFPPRFGNVCKPPSNCRR